MILRRSRFLHVVPLGDDRFLALHAMTHLRLGVDREVERIVAWFEEPRKLPEELPELMRLSGYDIETLAGCVASLLERDVLTQLAPREELAATATRLRETSGRDPGEMLERFRRRGQEGGADYWAVTATRGVAAFSRARRRLDLVLLGDCDLQMETDFLSREGEKWGLDARVAATFPDDARFVGEHKHDLILIGALRSRGAIATNGALEREDEPFALYLAEARLLIEKLRALSSAPILIDNLPEPTVQPLGIAERGLNGHRNRFRRANLALAQLAESFDDVHVVDIAAAFAAAGSQILLDDGLTSFTHFGSPGWMLQRPESEKAAVHDLFPDPAPLAAMVGGDPYRREQIAARAHIEAIVSVTGHAAKKCVIVDLDGVLWPGVLAETGSPFAWTPETSGPHSHIGLFFGIHEALKCLKRRGLVLVAVSKNDETVVRELWKYADHYPRERLLTPADFVTWRVNWNDKSDNIRSIADELGFALDAFLFIDDHPIERERVRNQLPEIEVWGEELFSLRRRLLSDPRLQPARVSQEAEARTDLVKAQLRRARLQAETLDETAFLASLDIHCGFEKSRTGACVERVRELFQRTTQFNTTGRKFSTAELTELLVEGAGAIYTMTVRDRFADHGLVVAAVVAVAEDRAEILNLAMSCRVIGLGVERRFIDAILDDISASRRLVVARINPTSRNVAARNVYRDAGFAPLDDGCWRKEPLEPRASAISSEDQNKDREERGETVANELEESPA